MISQAELNAMNRVTPSGIAERTYGAARVGKMTVGPSGMPIPRAKAAYRATVDGPLLQRLVDTALGAYARQKLTEERRSWVADILVDDIEARFPQAEMLVLQKHGHAHERGWLAVDMPEGASFRFDLPRPLVLNAKAAAIAYSPDRETLTPTVPDVTKPFFEDALHVEQQRKAMRGFDGINRWLSTFKRENSCAPRWAEIEAKYPILGEWLAAERQRMEGQS